VRRVSSVTGALPTCLLVSGERSLEVAAAGGVDVRAWALVRAAGQLRALRRYDEALQALDLACQLSPGERAELAVFACAIAIHCDVGEYELAVKLERSFAERGIDLRLSLVCLRLYSELYALTRDERHRERRDFYRAFVELLDTSAA
jgi:tetratricopeptide (TPR) repeat protein